MNIFEKIFSELNKAKVKYLVVGGMAVNLYGYVRFTGDLDIILLLSEQNLEKISKVMGKLGYAERIPVKVTELKDLQRVKKWLKEKNMQAFSFVPQKDSPLQIDIIIKESLGFEEIYKRKCMKKSGKINIPVVSVGDLVKMKKTANRPQDRIDVEALKNLKKL